MIATFLTLAVCFFISGLATGLNDLLVPHFKQVFALSHTQAVLVPAAFFSAYLVISPLAGKWLRRVEIRAGLLLSLGVMLLGVVGFFPAAQVKSFGLFLLGLFTVASGGTLMQFFVNPYASLLGKPEEASRRLTLLVGFTPLGTALAGPLCGPFLFGGDHLSLQDVLGPYKVIAACLFCLLFVVALRPWTKVELPPVTPQGAWYEVPQLRWGVVTMFAYVGAEVAIGSFLLSAAQLPEYGSLAARAASKLVGLYWGGAMLGRFVGPLYMRRLGPSFTLAAHALLAMLALMHFMATPGSLGLTLLVAVGYCHSIMFPTIFALSLAGLGEKTPVASAVLCTAIVGGAAGPLLQGFAADHWGVRSSFSVPLAGELMVGVFAWYTLRRRKA